MIVLSIDGQSWLTKLNRIGEKSAHNKQLVFNNIGHRLNREMLIGLFQKLDRKKSIGINGVTKADFEENFNENVNTLIKRIRKGSYKPKPARITEIPKEDGSKRPLATSCIEDKLVQLAASEILGKIYEPLFLPLSFGFRPGRNCHDALRTLQQSTLRNWKGAIVEIDIRRCFNEIPQIPFQFQC